jgi:hypothetical protein
MAQQTIAKLNGRLAIWAGLPYCSKPRILAE